MKPTLKLLKLSLIFSLASFSSFTLVAPPAQACGGFFCTTQPIDQAGERILFAKDGDEMVAHVQIQYTGPSEEFSWIVPAPTPPKLGVGSDELFNILRNATRPSFQVDIKQVGMCQPVPEITAEPTAEATVEPTVAPSINIISQQSVGPFESVVLSAKTPDDLKNWLKENGYQVPANVDPLLDPYVQEGFFFLALKLKKNSSTGDLQPITMRYKGDKPMIPIRLTAVAATPDMDVQVWLLGQHRGVPVNYNHVQINPARINWGAGGRNYRQTVIEGINEAGGKAFVTEYAGDSQLTNLNTLSPSRFNLGELLEATEPLAFRNLVIRQGFFKNSSRFDLAQAQELAFLKRYIKKPDSLLDISDDFFLNNLSQFAALLESKKITVNTSVALKELQERVIEPLHEIQNLFRTYPYLTALYTTLSPEEMTLDPSFDFNPDLPKVSNQFRATATQLCSPDKAPFEVPYQIDTQTEPSLTFEIESLRDNLDKTPAALKVEQLSPSGQGDPVKDNTKVILKAAQASLKTKVDGPDAHPFASAEPTPVSSSSGELSFPSSAGPGCSCQAPGQPFSDEGSDAPKAGAAYAFLGLGFLAWRKRKKN